jgi:hypothetical protein
MQRIAVLAISMLVLTPMYAFGADVRGAVLPPKRVGIVSLLGDTFHGFGMGLTRFNNVYYSSQVPDWNIDGTAAGILRAALNDQGGAAELLDIQPKHAQEFFLNGQPDDPDMKALRQLGVAQHFDTLILLIGNPDAHAPTSPGYGLFEQGAFGIHSVFPYADFRLTVLDVATGKRIATEFSYGVEGKRRKDIAWKATFEEYSPEEKALIREGIEEHIHNELERMLGLMKLTKPPA